MKRILLLILIVPLWLFAQEQVLFDDFDAAPADTNFWAWFDNHGGQHYQTNTNADSAYGWIHYEYVNDIVYSGAGALKLEYSAHNTESWGGYTKVEHWNPDSNGVYNWSNYDSIMVWYYNAVPQSLPGRVHFRFNLHDVSDAANGAATYDVTECEYYYSFHHILDDEPGWHVFKMALKDGRDDPNSDEWGGQSFNRTGWAGIQGNDVLDLDQIKGFSFEFSISGGGEGDYSQGTVIVDHIVLYSPAKKAFIFFNGKSLANALTTFTWGQSSMEVVEGVAPEGKNAIQWIPGDEWGNGWSGAGWNIDPPYDMSFIWVTDSLKFKMKAEEGTGTLRVQIEDGTAKRGMIFDPVADNQWHEYAFKLSEFPYQDGTSNFDSSHVSTLQFMTNGVSSAGKTILITDLWTGNPEIDVIPPAAPTGVTAVPADYYNLVIWQDVPGESEESYTVYASEQPITDVTAPGVEVVAEAVPEGTQSAAHFIYYPLKDKQVTRYYAVTCTDASGNVSEAGVSGAVENMAKGIPTISLTPPANFAADGDLSEWDPNAIMPFELKPSVSHVAGGTFDNDDDLTATCYLAVDDEYLYMAFDVLDDIFSYDPAGNFWEDDAIEVYIGLYNFTTQHYGFLRGEEPDYKFVLLKDGFHSETNGFDPAMFSNPSDNYNFTDFGTSDYVIEVKIPLDSLPTRNAAGDARFHPVNGMRIPLDLVIHDSDAPNVREGILSYSQKNNDTSWQGAQFWSYTWVGDTAGIETAIGDHNSVLSDFRLEQNFPNPFNPTTTITYALAKNVQVQLTVYNVLGQKVATLVNQKQNAGTHQVTFDARDLSSGVYMYQIKAGDFVQTRKMLLIK
ncbi:hypothetical protein Calab_3510 [Caldithrix abyssi DSM 13497]|uniref:Por secretion system C-terminal sorting domain-containing protein n=1 Tax=Caldithrix abyssi DSM 13497 TaxID=880073 RepID=H1XXI5_CALAY|nr:sugar-binding protein [Caldithrix abyssi]APF19197.1 Por secretion system C-terminal sorting domain-containing protein [Caldithrix abyssi DSM 13497]EHO43109.1 hypothetical protein Calab_3510 [Caldithrix abyssi DSM 13497]